MRLTASLAIALENVIEGKPGAVEETRALLRLGLVSDCALHGSLICQG